MSLGMTYWLKKKLRLLIIHVEGPDLKKKKQTKTHTEEQDWAILFKKKKVLGGVLCVAF